MDDTECELGISARERRDYARRQFCRRVCSAIIGGMAVTDSDFSVMAIRIGKTEEGIRQAIMRLMDGKSISLNLVSDLFFSMGLQLVFSLERQTVEFQAIESRPGSPVTPEQQPSPTCNNPGETPLPTQPDCD